MSKIPENPSFPQAAESLLAKRVAAFRLTSSEIREHLVSNCTLRRVCHIFQDALVALLIHSISQIVRALYITT